MGENWVVRQGTNRVVRRGTIGLFPGSATFPQCFIGYLPLGGNWVVRRGTIYNYGPLCREISRFVNLRGSCFAEGLPEGKQPPEGCQIWIFPYTEGRNCFIMFYYVFANVL